MRFNIQTILTYTLPAFLLMSCSHSPQRERPTIPMAEKFSGTGEIKLEQKWWESLHDPMLNALVDKALAGNFSLKTVWSRMDQATAIARQAGANLSPTLDAGATAARNWNQQPGSVTVNTYQLGLTAAYEIDLWGRIDSVQKAAELDLLASKAQLQTAHISLSAQVAKTWYQLVEQYGQHELLEQQLENNKKVLALVSLRFRHGKVSATDVLQQKLLLETRHGEIANTLARISILEHQLATLVGETPTTVVARKVSRMITIPALPATGLPMELLHHRPDIQQAYYNLLASDQRMAAAMNNELPRISLAASATTSGNQARDLFNDWASGLAANLALPIIDGGRRKAETDRTRAVVQELLDSYRQTVLDALAEVEDALSSEQRQREFIASLEKQSNLSKQVILRVRDNYINGQTNYLSVLDALITDETLARNQLQARRQLIEYRIDLCKALAGSWELSRPAMDDRNTRAGM